MTQRVDRPTGNRCRMLGKWLMSAVMVTVALNVWSIARGGELCLQYAQDNSVIAGLEDTSGSAAAKDAQQVFDGFLEQARHNDVPRILALYSRLDGSQDYLREELTKIPDKFTGYAGLKSVKTLRSFQWDNYQLLLTEYIHARGRLVMAEPVFCTNACQISNIFERPDAAVDRLSRFIYLSQDNRAPTVACPAPDAMSVFEIVSTLRLGQVAPLHLYFRKDLFAAVTDDHGIPVDIPDGIKECHAEILRLPPGEDQQARAAIQKLLDQCTVNTKPGSLIPVVAVTETPLNSLYDVSSFLGMIRTAKDIKPLFRIEDHGRVIIGTLVTSPLDETLYALFPMRLDGSLPRFDWNFFGGGLAEALTSREVGRHLFKVLDAARQEAAKTKAAQEEAAKQQAATQETAKQKAAKQESAEQQPTKQEPMTRVPAKKDAPK